LYLDHLRKTKRTPMHQTVDGHSDITELSAAMDGADHTILQEQRLEKIRRMILLLPEDQQEIIILRHYVDLSFKEIAGILNISINTALGRIRYALMNLRRIMKDKEISF
jgi:RNA polymerase sigma factor (sigma-70 family)